MVAPMVLCPICRCQYCSSEEIKVKEYDHYWTTEGSPKEAFKYECPNGHIFYVLKKGTE